MPTYFARKAGNINAADVWATTPSGTASAVTFASGDVLVANSFAIAINVDTNLGGAGQVRNDPLGGATAGGTFTLAAGVTLTANVLQNNAAGGATVVLFSGVTPQQAWIVGNVTSPVNTSGGITPINISNSGTLNFTGNATGDMHGTGIGGAIALTSIGTLNFTGNATGGGGALGYAIENRFSGTVNITGNCYGAVAPAVGNNSTGTVTINGQAIGSTTTGGGAGVANTSTGGVIVKRAIGGSYGPGSTGVTAAPGVSNSLLGVVSVEEIEFGINGMSPTSGGGIRLKKLGSNVAVFNYCDTAGAKTLVDATQGQMPAATDVRSGVSYASGALTGSCAVPAAGSVALGVAVGAGFGTAVLTPEAVWGHASRTITGGTVDTLTNAPTVPSVVQIRQEMDANSTRLSNLDTSVSSRLASASYQAPSTPPTAAEITTAVWAAADKTGYSLTSAERSAIAAAVEGSLLNEADGQAVLNAIVGAIGNTNLSEVSLVAAVRADLERTGGKLDSIPTTAAPSASSVAGAVRTELGVELGRLDASVSSRLAPSGTLATVTNLTNAPASVTPSDIWSHASRTITGGTVDTLTNAPSVPSASAIASQVRTELSVELGRVDQNISSRLAAADYTAPSAAPTVTAIRQEMDSNSTKLANLDATVSSRLASSAYSAAPTTAQIATAVEGSLLNEADGQAVLNALVGAIGNTNLSEVSLVAAVRADLERNGGKLDSIPTTAAPSASAVAGAVRTELGVELGRLDASVSSRLAPSGTLATVTNLTNAPASVTPSDIWSHSSRTLTSASGPTAVQIRQEIDANSTKLDAAISSRMAASEVTKLDAVKAKTDALNTERLASVPTVNILGTLLAQANS